MATVDSITIPPRVKDLTGQRFGRWAVLRYAGLNTRRKALWLCKCDCGTARIVESSNLCAGTSQNCGCIRCEKTAARSITHGLWRVPEYNTWAGMLARCYNANEVAYVNYGGRGIAVCDRWRNSFEAFYEDMGPRPSPQHSIDRIDNDGNYEPANCQWATRTQQARNSRQNLLISFRGKTQCLAAWSQEIGILPGTLRSRLFTLGWPVERSMTESVHTKCHFRHSPALSKESVTPS